jgi:hypothetical protein
MGDYGQNCSRVVSPAAQVSMPSRFARFGKVKRRDAAWEGEDALLTWGGKTRGRSPKDKKLHEKKRNQGCRRDREQFGNQEVASET